jgi:hypothetical protein
VIYIVERYAARGMILLGFAIALLALAAGSASAEDSLPWTDDFDDGKLDNWTVETAGGGTVVVDQTQSKSSPYALHIKCPSRQTDKGTASPNITYNRSLGILIQFDFRIANNYHWMILWYTYETQLVVSGDYLIARESYRNRNIQVQSISTNRWYHIAIHYNMTSRQNTIWVDGVEKLTWEEDRYWSDRRFVGDVFASDNHGEAFWDNFNISYHNAPEVPVPISPIDNASFNWTPDLEWEFEDASPGDHQTAYHIQIANDTEFGNLIWDSGIIDETDSSTNTTRRCGAGGPNPPSSRSTTPTRPPYGAPSPRSRPGRTSPSRTTSFRTSPTSTTCPETSRWSAHRPS